MQREMRDAVPAAAKRSLLTFFEKRGYPDWGGVGFASALIVGRPRLDLTSWQEPSCKPISKPNDLQLSGPPSKLPSRLWRFLCFANGPLVFTVLLFQISPYGICVSLDRFACSPDLFVVGCPSWD
jgi:hypothetical protein